MAKPVLLPILALLVVMEYSATIASASPADVNIWNQVGEWIQIHCQSGDRDLKEMTLVAGQTFGWGFTPNIWGTTLFHCSFRWGTRHQHFDVWTDHGWDGTKRRPCKHCEWRVRPDGFYRNSVGQPPVLVHPWL
ncbi:hypothetical protein M758_12G019400 [Ceratodon purpureus]|uniref:S-protein homolog n=1 Tax=Ceratodon purpureus TaxID=3225 RepID=A0A8T0G361_CERPU|nr:hypothetical protein KC19_12G018700 [Ceratodon purpureus]KAG0597764.1 hypothetical protein M758_12G019400 [Ceratodon purpureus]